MAIFIEIKDKLSKLLISLALAALINTPLHAKMETKTLAAENPAMLMGGAYYALIIGNAAYSDQTGGWLRLTTPIQDARELAGLLSTKYGFKETYLIENADHKTIINAFKKLKGRLTEKDHALIYYAGHGYIDDDKVGYWVPINAQGDSPGEFIHHAQITAEIKRVAGVAKHTLLIADSCFSGDLLSVSRGNQDHLLMLKNHINAWNNDSFNRYIYKISQHKSVQILTASGNEPVIDEYGGTDHSPFAYFLLKKLSTNSSIFLTKNDLTRYITASVASNTEQTPQSGILRNAGDEGGEFIFFNTSAKNTPNTYPLYEKEADTVGNDIQNSEAIQTIFSQTESRTKRKWYKNPWVWAGILATGFAASQSGGGGGSNTETVTTVIPD